MPIISAMPIIISATNFPVQCPSFALIFLPPCKLHTVIHFPQASQSLNGRRKETASISAFLQPCSFFQKCFIQSCENLSWQSYAEELISNGQYWRWRRWWPIGHPRRRCLKLNLGFNWRVCSPFTSSVHFTPSSPVFNIDQCCSHPLPPPMFNIDQLGCQIVQARTASSGMFSEHWSHL